MAVYYDAGTNKIVFEGAPTHDELHAAVDGKRSLDFGSLNVALDAASIAQAVLTDNTAITIRADSVVADITTTGAFVAETVVDGVTISASDYTIATAPTEVTLDGGVYHIASDIDVSGWTLLNGASFVVDVDNVTITARGIDISTFDTSGRTGVVIVTGYQTTIRERSGLSFSVYPTEVDRRLEQNALASNVTTYTFEYNDRLSDTYYLWVNIGAQSAMTYSVQLSVGDIELDLGMSGQLSAIDNKTTQVDAGVQRASLLIPYKGE